jgi:hypothetical protein
MSDPKFIWTDFFDWSLWLRGHNAYSPEKLKTTLAAIKNKRSYMRAVNKHWAEHKTMKGFRRMSDKAAAKIDKQLEARPAWARETAPYAAEQLADINSAITRMKEIISARRELNTIT